MVVPCYNEAEGAAALVATLVEVRAALGAAWDWECICVDDGSRDGTAERLEAAARGRLPLCVVRHPANRGLGGALKTGFAHATGDVVATADSDCTYDPREIPPMLRMLESGLDVVVASAHHPRGAVENVAPLRLLMSRVVSRLYRLILGADLYTYTGLLRVYRAEVVRSVPFRSDDFLGVTEILVGAMLRGYRVGEHPTVLRRRTLGSSKAIIPRVIKDHVLFMLGLALRGRRASPTRR